MVKFINGNSGVISMFLYFPRLKRQAIIPFFHCAVLDVSVELLLEEFVNWPLPVLKYTCEDAGMEIMKIVAVGHFLFKRAPTWLGGQRKF